MGTSDRGRVEQRDEQMIALGFLLDPIRRLIHCEEDATGRIPYISSQFQQDFKMFKQEASKFCQMGDHHFSHEEFLICDVLEYFASDVLDVYKKDGREKAQEKFDQLFGKVQSAIRAVPCDDPGTILASKSPYSTYIRLRAICLGATTRLDLFDPYLDAETFHRYLREFPDGVRVRVVTSGGIMNVSPTSGKVIRRDRIVAVSELLALQYPDRYQFRVISEQHDRHIRVDDEILHLGGSSNDAAKSKYFTISNLNPVESNHTFLDGIISRATEWFGPSTPTHRRS